MANFGHLVAFRKAVLGWHKAENMRRSVLHMLISIPFHVEYYDLDETYKDFVKILLTVHKRVYDMKHKMDIWFFQEEKNMKNISTKNTKVSA